MREKNNVFRFCRFSFFVFSFFSFFVFYGHSFSSMHQFCCGCIIFVDACYDSHSFCLFLFSLLHYFFSSSSSKYEYEIITIAHLTLFILSFIIFNTRSSVCFLQYIDHLISILYVLVSFFYSKF